MAIAQNSQSQFTYIAETSFGVTPATPTMKALSRKSGGLVETRGLINDEAIFADRMMRSPTQGNSTVEGDLSLDMRDGDLDELFESVMLDTWTSNVLKVGTTVKSFTTEDSQSDISQYFLSTGVIVNTMAVSMGVESEAPVEVTLGLKGKDHILSGTTAATAVTPASGSIPMTSFNHSVKIADQDGTPVDVCVTSIDFNIDNQFELARCVGSKYVTEFINGQVLVTGSFTAYFRNENLYNRFLNFTNSALEIPVDDSTGTNTYTFFMPNVTFTAASTPVEGPNGARVVSIDFAAYHDETEGSNLVITRPA